ncbi:unnamed protein product [Amaranthus hypochondriacus]
MKELFIVSFQKLGPAYIRTVRELVKETLFLIFQLLQNEKYEGTLHRENELLSDVGDIKSLRQRALFDVKKLIEANPKFHDKLNFPAIKDDRLWELLDQSLNWQHTRCNTPKPEPIFNTLFEDHKCGQSRPMAMNNSMMNTAPESRPRNSPCCFS